MDSNIDKVLWAAIAVIFISFALPLYNNFFNDAAATGMNAGEGQTVSHVKEGGDAFVDYKQTIVFEADAIRNSTDMLPEIHNIYNVTSSDFDYIESVDVDTSTISNVPKTGSMVIVRNRERFVTSFPYTTKDTVKPYFEMSKTVVYLQQNTSSNAGFPIATYVKAYDKSTKNPLTVTITNAGGFTYKVKGNYTIKFKATDASGNAREGSITAVIG